jgi:hypothetical protein
VAFDWVRFLETNHIHFVTSGPNVSRGHVAIHCPLCGSEDHSQHMSVNIKTGGWRCFRRPEMHRGGNPAGLVAALLGMSYGAAAELVGSNVHIPDNLLGTIRALLGPKQAPVQRRLILPGDFKPFDGRRSSERFVKYLQSRNYTMKQIATMTEEYGIRFATTGRQKGRVIFPIWFYGQLVTWTGRTIYDDQELRYLTLSADPETEDEPAHGPINDYLLFFDQLLENVEGCDTLILCEGPFDALKVSILGRRHGIDATCFFTASPSQTQIDLLFELVPNYKHRYLLLDQGTLATALKTQQLMQGLKFRVLTLPKSLKDPGLLNEKSLLEIVP